MSSVCCGGKKKAEFSFEQEFSGAELNVEHPLGFQSGFIFFFPLIISVLVHKGGMGSRSRWEGTRLERDHGIRESWEKDTECCWKRRVQSRCYLSLELLLLVRGGQQSWEQFLPEGIPNAPGAAV